MGIIDPMPPLRGTSLRRFASSWGIEKAKRETEKSLRARIMAQMQRREMPEPILEVVKPRRWLLTFLWTWQADLISFTLTLLIRLMWGRTLFWADGLWTELREYSWPRRTWYKGFGGTTFCHGGFVSYDMRDRVIPHELHHVEQIEARMLAGFVLGLTSAAITLWFGASNLHAILALEVPWFGSWIVNYLASLAQAYLRGEDPYRGSHLEEAAYALTDKA